MSREGHADLDDIHDQLADIDSTLTGFGVLVERQTVALESIAVSLAHLAHHPVVLDLTHGRDPG